MGPMQIRIQQFISHRTQIRIRHFISQRIYFFYSFSVCEVSEKFQNLKKFDAVVSKGKKAIFVYFVDDRTDSKKAIPLQNAVSCRPGSEIML